MIYFKKNLSFLRSEKKMTLRTLSKEIGFSLSQLNNYELGLSFPKFLDLIKISKYFEVSESDLIHKDLQLNRINNLKEEKNQEVLISLQNKIIKIQEEKIKELEIQIINLKKKI